MRHLFQLGLILPTFCLFACTGAVGDTLASGGFVERTASGDGAAAAANAEAALEACGTVAGGPTIRRLNKTELANAVGDVFGINAEAYLSLPQDGSIGGFTTVGTQLSSGGLFTNQLIDISDTLAGEIAQNVIDCSEGSGAMSCVDDVLAPYARLLFRRDFTGEEKASLTSMMDQVTQSASFADAERAAVMSLLLSPNFLFVTNQSENGMLVGRDLATRLSLMFWKSVPDTELLEAVPNLGDPEVQHDQVLRLMGDMRFERFANTFVSEWLTLVRLDGATVDVSKIHREAGKKVTNSTPNSEKLTEADWVRIRENMKGETLAFFKNILVNNLPLSEIFSARHTFLNGDLTAHYGFGSASGAAFERTDFVEGDDRLGIFTQGAVLSQSSSGDHASIVERGDAIVSRFLCEVLPDPPESLLAELNELATSDKSEVEKMRIRADNPQCAGCHSVMDPVGYSFHRFDLVSRYDVTEEAPETSVKGTAVNGVREMIGAVADSTRFETCATEKLMIYALGRRVLSTNEADACYVNETVDSVRANGGGLQDLLVAVAMSPTMTTQGSN